jgi:hypothetical protein
MCRLAVLFIMTTLASASAWPGAAAERSTADHAAEALNLVFPMRQTPEQSDIFGYASLVLTGLDGKWLPLTILYQPSELGADAPAGIAEALTTFCSEPKVTRAIVKVGDYGFSIRRSKASDTGVEPVAIEYTSIGGSSFASHTDASAFLASLGYKPDPDSEEIRASSVRGRQSLFRDVTVFRPYPDVLVLAPDRDVPEIYVRCPAS